MKQLEKKFTTCYRWWRTDGKPINPKHVEELNEHALDRISEWINDGIVAGQLLHDIRGPDCRPRWETSYEGWWEMKEVE